MAINNALITELEILNIKNNIYKELLNDLEMHKKNESLICSVKKIIKNNHKIRFETLKFYLSSVTLIERALPVWKEEESFHLIDFEERDSNALCLEIPDGLTFDAIQFNLGIDSLTNVSGALGGDGIVRRKEFYGDAGHRHDRPDASCPVQSPDPDRPARLSAHIGLLSLKL